MIDHATAIEFVRPATQGRTGPLIMMCETAAGEIVELFCKLSVGCDQGVINLGREAVAACLAADLNLPVPKPYLVTIPLELVQAISDETVAGRLGQSVSVAFGSTNVPNQFSAWGDGNRVSDILLPTAAAILVFDGIIQNPDRRAGNPNCLVKGDQVRIIDHELAFANELIIGWLPPWALGGLNSYQVPGNHIFCAPLRGRAIDFDPIVNLWQGLSDARLNEYENTLPPEWAEAQAVCSNAINLVANARDHMAACITEVQRILAT